MITYPKRKYVRQVKGRDVGPVHTSKIRGGSKLISKADPPLGGDSEKSHRAAMREGSAKLLAKLLPELRRIARERRAKT
jgi:hypothetical protein